MMSDALNSNSKTFEQSKLYSSSDEIKTRFSGSKASKGDKIGIIPLGQLKVEDCVDIRSIADDGEVIFPSYNLPQSKTDFYQFVYITNGESITVRSLPFIIQIPLDELTPIQEDYLNYGAEPGSPNVPLAACVHLANMIQELRNENADLMSGLRSEKIKQDYFEKKETEYIFRNKIRENVKTRRAELTHEFSMQMHKIDEIMALKDDFLKQEKSSLQFSATLNKEADILFIRNNIIKDLINKKKTSKDIKEIISNKEEHLCSLEESKQNTLLQIEVMQKENALLNEQMENLRKRLHLLCKKKTYVPKPEFSRAQIPT